MNTTEMETSTSRKVKTDKAVTADTLWGLPGAAIDEVSMFSLKLSINDTTCCTTGCIA